MKRQVREDAQDKIVAQIAFAALSADEAGDHEIAEAIRILGARIAKQYGLSNVPGLPDTVSR